MNSIEFEMTTDLSQELPSELAFNYSQLKEFLESNLAVYKGLVITEDKISEAKDIKAKVNKISKAISDQRIAIKKRYMEPYEVFEAQCKELVGICSSVTDNITAQLNEYEEARKDKKIGELCAYFDSAIAGEICEGYITFSSIYNSKWENKTFSMESAKSEIDTAIAQSSTHINAIRMLKSENEIALLDLYKDTHDLTAVIQKNTQLVEAAKREAERKEKLAAMNAVNHVTAPVSGDIEKSQIVSSEPEQISAISQNESLISQAPDDTKEQAVSAPEKLIELAFKIRVTKAQLAGLKEYMDNHGITPMRI